MFPSDPTFNELHIREKQMLLGAILIWLNDCAQYSETTQEQNDIINKIIDLVEEKGNILKGIHKAFWIALSI